MTLNTIAVVIPWSVNNDSRAQRTIRVLEQFGPVDVFFIPENSNDTISIEQYASTTQFIKLPTPKRDILYKIYAHTFFYKIYDYFLDTIYKTNKHYNLVYIHDLISGNIGLQLKKKFNCKLIYDIHDLYIETINQQFPTLISGKPKIIYRPIVFIMKTLGRYFERTLIKKADLTFTVNQSCQEFLIEQYKQTNIKYFHNFPEYRVLPQKNSVLSELLGITDPKNYIIYIGSLGKGRHLEEIVECSMFLNPENILVIIGNGHLKSPLLKIANDKNLINKKIYFLDSIKYNLLFDTITEAKIGLMLLDPINKSKELAFANKITEYMLCAIPPLLSNHKEHQKLMAFADVGFLIEDYSPINIANKVNQILTKPDILNQKSKNSRMAFEKKYNWKEERERLTLEISKLVPHNIA
jgi:glycosyltransferase involved in cell wall biosynthesis